MINTIYINNIFREIIYVIIYIKNKFKSNFDNMNRTIWTAPKNCMTY
jgi:hypothetical protein